MNENLEKIIIELKQIDRDTNIQSLLLIFVFFFLVVLFIYLWWKE